MVGRDGYGGGMCDSTNEKREKNESATDSIDGAMSDCDTLV